MPHVISSLLVLGKPYTFTLLNFLFYLPLISGCGIKCRENPLELVFVIDSSESVGPENFERIKRFVKTMIDAITVNQATTRIGIINFSLKVEVVSTLQQFPFKDSLKNAVDAMQYYGEGTHTATAISKAIDIFQMARQGVRKVAVVITDGQADQRDPHKLEVVVREAHALKIEIFVIGVVQKTDPNFENFRKEMDLIATDPDSDHVYQIDDFMTLQGKGKLPYLNYGMKFTCITPLNI